MSAPPKVKACPPWNDSRGLRHFCRSHVAADWCQCPCGALHPTEPEPTDRSTTCPPAA